ncbi:lysylphosphatidylglycerol synthase transmembrane domain-containing protein [Thiohalocapsa sp. ML1]|uniref:lysylphosphatidylglycerol synthase transmembrane domain-containing protein n=1 Tax=Thiohalocapsa sp. ML1 TaxID=1431688 RepID=UPI0007320DDB|nr:lysylphosphatidylglycerol synthase transmembrane domain-containing protein [Thiohalocapsa sp. ML1]
MKRAASLGVAAAVTAATLTYALWGADLGALWRTLAGGALWVMLPFLAVLAVFFASNAQRWAWMLRPFGRFSPQQLLPSMMIGFAANNLLPLRVGELIRAYLLAKDAGLAKSGVLMNLALERLLDLIGILVIYVAALALLPAAPAAFRTSAWLAAAAVLGLALVLAAFMLAPRQIDALWRRLALRLPARLGQRGSIYLAQFEQGLSAMRTPALAALLIGYSIGRWLLAVALAWLAIYAYAGAVALPVAMVTIGITAFAVALPSAPGFVGPMQAAFVLALTPFGIEREAALAASVLFLLGHWIPVTAVGALYLASRHLSFREVAAEAEAEPAMPPGTPG